MSVVNAGGREIRRCTVAHTAAGLRELVGVLTRSGAGEAAIERPDGPVIDALPGAGITVVVISPGQVKNLRGRYGSAGNKDDRFDAFVLADTLRTDRARLVPLTPDSPATVSLRRACRARKDLIRHRVALANQLRAHLHNVFPAGQVFSLRSTRPSAWPSWPASIPRTGPTGSPRPRMGRWLSSIGYSGHTDPAVLHARLAAATRGITGPDADAQAAITHAMHAVLVTLTTQIKALSAQIATQLAAHADSHIFTSLPRSGTVRAARLLAEIGDCRARFPAPQSLACLARAAPSTRQSGKMRSVTFRYACDKQLRDAVTDFAGDTRHASPWAASLYQRARARGHDHPHAVRILARAWLFVIWHCWQDHAAYDPARHRALQRLLEQDQQAAA